jgi:hypothetical protein
MMLWPFPWLKREPALFCTPFWYIGFNRGWGEPTVPEGANDREGLLRYLSAAAAVEAEPQ